MPHPSGFDAGLLAAYEHEKGSSFGREYDCKFGKAMDFAADEGQIATDDGAMVISIPFAASRERDRVGDFLEVQGIETANHEKNPQAFTDHGKKLWWPLGLDQDEAKRYTVTIDGDVAKCRIYVSTVMRENVQMYEFYKKGLIRAGSIGYRPLEFDVIPADVENGWPKGKHLKRVELLETSAVFLPCNQDSVQELYSGVWDGKGLCDVFREQLEPVRPRKRAMANGADLPLLRVEVYGAKSMATTVAKPVGKGKSMGAMSAADSTAGGALVPPAESARGGVKDTIDTHGNGDSVETPDEAPLVPHGAQKLADLHFLHSAGTELLNDHPELVDNPAVREALEKKVGPLVQQLCEMLEGIHAEHYPDIEPLGKSVEDADQEVVDREKPTTETGEEEPAGVAKDVTTKEEDAKLDKPKDEGKSLTWHAPTPKVKTKGATVANKSAKVPGRKACSPAVMKALDEMHDNLMTKSDDPGMPMDKSKAIYGMARKLASLTTEKAPGGTENEDANFEALQNHVKDIAAMHDEMANDPGTPKEAAMDHYHMARKAEELHSQLGEDAAAAETKAEVVDEPRAAEDAVLDKPKDRGGEKDEGVDGEEMDDNEKAVILRHLKDLDTYGKAQIESLNKRLAGMTA